MKKLLLLSLSLFSVVAAWAESDKSLEEMMGDMAEEVGKAYVSPITEGFCTNMNSAWFNKAPEDEVLGLDIELSIVAMGATVGEGNKTFDMTTSSNIKLSRDLFEDLATKIIEDQGILDDQGNPTGQDKEEAISELADELWKKFGDSGAGVKIRAFGPTVAGSGDDKVKFVLETGDFDITINEGKTTYSLDSEDRKTIQTDINGLDLSIVPLAAFQISLGTLYGTKATFRFLPPLEIDDEIGELSYYGGALQHNPKMFLPVLDVLPFDLGVLGSYQIFKLGDIIEATAWTAGVNVSKQFGWDFLNITPYAGLMLESSQMTFSYDYELETSDGTIEKSAIEFEEDGPNSFRVPVGLGVRLGLINISGEYYFAEQSGFAANVALAF